MPAKKSTGTGKSSVKAVVTGKGGHGRATVPLLELAPMRFHIGRILVPIDFSEPSRKALHYAKLFAQQFDASLVLLHAIEPLAYPPDFAVVPLLPPDVEEIRNRELETQLDELAANVGGGVKTEAVVRNGRAWQEVVEYAGSGKVDLIIVSTHGYTGLKHALLGSVAEKIVRHAPCPVLVVRDEEHDFA
jgi:nucleotide-binding universal stress UspA family protein